MNNTINVQKYNLSFKKYIVRNFSSDTQYT